MTLSGVSGRPAVMMASSAFLESLRASWIELAMTTKVALFGGAVPTLLQLVEEDRKTRTVVLARQLCALNEQLGQLVGVLPGSRERAGHPDDAGGQLHGEGAEAFAPPVPSAGGVDQRTQRICHGGRDALRIGGDLVQ